MKNLLPLGAVCALLLLPASLTIATPHEPPGQSRAWGRELPAIQDPPLRDDDYPSYCDQTETMGSVFRTRRECFQWYRYSGFDVAVHRGAIRDQDAATIGLTLDTVRADLLALSLRVPIAALDKLRGTLLILTDQWPCHQDWLGCYRASQDIYWIRITPDARGRTIASIWPVRNNILMHELAHAFHAQHLPDGYSNSCVISLYDASAAEGLYDNVAYHHEANNPTDHSTLWHGEHYAMQDAQEFFAELSAAYFIGSNYEPYNRSMFLEMDRGTARAIQEIWEGKRCHEDSAQDSS